MGARTRSVLRIAAATIALVAATGLTPGSATAAIGDLLRAIPLKQTNGTDLCPPININGIGNGTTGTSVAIAQASKLGFFRPSYQPKAVLVTSCLGGSTDTARKSTIYFVNPDTGMAVGSITTPSFVPPRGWSAIALRPEKADFIACVATGSSTGNLDIYKISFEGATAALVTSANGALKGAYCDGLAWDYDSDDPQDPNKKTIYASKDGGTTVRRWISTGNNDSFTQVSTDLGASPNPLPSNCLNSGLAMVDGALFVACQGVSSGTLANAGHLVHKSTPGPALSSLPLFAQTLADDIECDAVTFAELVANQVGPDALWAKNRTTNTLNAFELPGFTCGRSLGPAVTIVPPSFKGPGACPTWYPDAAKTDTDGDGLLDCWEDPLVWTPVGSGGLCPATSATCNSKPGIDWDGDGNKDIDLCVDNVCADRLTKDVFVEADSMVNHPFSVTARQQVIDAFANAPVPGGIRLHVLLDDGNGTPGIPHTKFVALEPCTPRAATTDDVNLDVLKKSYFGTATERGLAEPQRGKTLFAKRMAFRWALFAHDLKPPATNLGAKSSGCAKIGGDDLVVTLGSLYAGTLVLEPAATLTPSATSGNGVTFIASAGVFASTDVGKILRDEASSGRATIKTVVAATQVTADIDPARPFANTSPIQSGSWQLLSGDVVPPAHVNGDDNDLAGTFMHEIGHTLGLRHGGPNNDNCKPNYLSVMSYTRQFSDGKPLVARRLDYSRNALPLLNELAGLREADGIGTPVLPPGVLTDQTVFAADNSSGGRVVVIRPAGGNIDWNQSCPNPDPDLCINTDTVLHAAVNNFAFSDSDVSGCDALPDQQLIGYDDWGNLQYNHRASVDVAAGGSNEVNDPADGLTDAFQNVDNNGDGLPDGVCPATGQPWEIAIQSPIALNQTPGGDTQVKFFSLSAGCSVANLDPSTLTLSGSAGPGGVKLKNNGSFNCSSPDLNKDGLPDFVCHFDDNGFVIGDAVGIVEGRTFPDLANPKGVGFRAQGPVVIQ